MTYLFDGNGEQRIPREEPITAGDRIKAALAAGTPARKTMLRLKTRASTDLGEAEAHMEALSKLDGTYAVYREGDYIISLHEDTRPLEPFKVKRVARVQGFVLGRQL